MSEASSSISPTNNTPQSVDRSILNQFFNEETDNMPNSIATNTSTNNNFTRANTERARNTTREKIKQETFDYNNEDGLRGFIDYLNKNSNNIRYFPIGIMSSFDKEISNTISDQYTDKAKIFDQIADYCNTQQILSKSLEKKYARMKKEINEIKKLENEKNTKIANLKNEYEKKRQEWVKKNIDRKALSQEDKAFNPELEKFTENYLKQRQQIETKYRKKIELRKAKYLHTHKFENWGKYINRNENYCTAKYGQRWKNKMLNKDSKITQNGAKYSDILEYLKNFLEREKNENKDDKDKENIIDQLISIVKTWLGLAKEEKTNKKDIDIIKDLQMVVNVYNALVKKPENNRLNLDTISKDVLNKQGEEKEALNKIQQSSKKAKVNIEKDKENNTSKIEDNISQSTKAKSGINSNKVSEPKKKEEEKEDYIKKFNEIKQNFNEPISQSSNKAKVNIEKDKDNNTSKIEDNISTTAQSSESIDANKLLEKKEEKKEALLNKISQSFNEEKQQKDKDNNTSTIEDDISTAASIDANKLLDKKKKSQSKDNLEALRESLKQALNDEKENNGEKEIDMQALQNNQQTEFMDNEDDSKTVNEDFDHMKDYNVNMLDKIKEDIKRDEKFIRGINKNNNNNKENSKLQIENIENIKDNFTMPITKQVAREKPKVIAASV